MKKQVIAKILSIVMIVLVVFTSISLIHNSVIENNEDDKKFKKYLMNDHFDPSLTGPAASDVTEYFSMTTLYNYIKTQINSVENADDSTKEAKDLQIASWIETNVGSNKVAISNASELFMFGNAQSINLDKQGGSNTYIFENTITKVLSLNYVLTSDIDYSTMKAQKFVPIGTDINIELEGNDKPYIKKFQFNGTFDGNGFEIRNLYLAEFLYLSTTFSDGNETTEITIPTIKYYAMFSSIGEDGVVKNLILRNPSYELILIDDTGDIFSFATLAGENYGEISNVGVIDKRVNSHNEDVSGITFTISHPTNKLATAGGFVHTNYGVIKNSYYASKNIINPASMFRFSQVAPFVHTNNNPNGITYSGYENIAVVKPANFNPGNIPSFTPEDLIYGDIEINEDEEARIKWHFYPSDGYPILYGLNYNEDEDFYEIYDEYDFIAFSKLINFDTPARNNKSYNEQVYVLKNDINLINFKGYKTPNKEFNGTLKSEGEDFTLGGKTNTNKYIYNLNISKPYIVGNKYYLGLFSVLTGTVQNINLYNNKVTITSSNSDYGKTFYVGSIAGELREGLIKNIVSNTTVDLGSEAIGITYAGGLVGTGNGTITFVANLGIVNGGEHKFENKSINASYYVGGIIGSNNGPLTVSYSQNHGIITAVGSYDDKYSVLEPVESYVGGIIGEANNISNDTVSLVYLTNYGEINGGKFIGTSAQAHIYVGGIFGSVKGYGFKLNSGSNVYNGALENAGLITGEYLNENTYLYAAGIGVANTTESFAKISYMSNQEGFDIEKLNYQTHNKNIFYAATIVDNSVGGIELSRAYNYFEYTFGKSYFTAILELTDPTEIMIAPLFTSVTNVGSKLLYVENYGKLTVGSETEDLVVPTLMKISNITQATKVDYKNVTNSGEINVLRIDNQSDIFVAGITWVLPYINRAYTMQNVVNDASIITAGIRGNTVIGSYSGVNYTEANYVANFSAVRNLYVAGIVNLNVGEIRNVFNLGKITSYYDDNIKNITGTANSFVGGIVTFNYNLVQDAANSGNIIYTNSSNNARSYYAGVKNNGTNNSELGGITIIYEGGLTLGGIVSAFGNIAATILEGYKVGFTNGFETNISNMPKPIEYAKVKDTINSGDVFGKSKEFVRSAGILGLALSAELQSGTYESKNQNTTNGPFARGILGSADPVGKSLLSNGLNYGNIYAITQTIAEFVGQIGTGEERGHANYERPGINASAGGVVAYGLTEMVRMINHGTVVSTDVAGGVIGATYILGGATTTININTAVHYGKVKAAINTNFADIEYDEEDDFTSTTKYYPDESTFLFPNHNYDLSIYHNDKRGFGGFIGRLQRGRNGVMHSTNFINIMNMDKNVDLIGRTDMNSITVSRSYYRLHSSNSPISYYSAREKDTTNYVVVGWYYQKRVIYSFNNSNVRFTIRRGGSGSNRYYYITKIEVLNTNTVIEDQTLTKRVVSQSGSSASYINKEVNRKIYVNGTIYEGTSTDTAFRIANFGIQTNEVANVDSQVITKTGYTYSTTTRTPIITYSNATENPPTNNILNLKYAVEHIHDIPNHPVGKNIFDNDFPLKSSANTEYIYPVDEDALATRFKAGGENEKPNGMYVLASSTGGLDGATLPTNLKINNLLKLDETTFRYIDLENVSIGDLVNDEQDDYSSRLEDTYLNMYQLNYNNKAEILPENMSDQVKIAELVLYDPNGNSPILTRGVVNYNANPKTITFEVSNSAFSQNQIYYEVKSNTLSQNAIIGKSNISFNDYNAFISDYDKSVDGVLPSNSLFKFSYSGTLNNGGTVTIPIKVYSEIAIKDPNIFASGKYTETYNIIIKRIDTSITTNATIILNQNTPYQDSFTVSSIGANYNVEDSKKLIPNGSLDVTFTGSTDSVKKLIPQNHLMKVHRVVLVNGQTETEIDPNYYSLTIKPNINNYFGFTIGFSDLLKEGQYKIYYSYYDNSAIRSISVKKDKSSLYDIIELSYLHFSSDLAGLDKTFARTDSKSFTTYIEFGYQIPYVTKSVQTLSILTQPIDSNAPSYVDNIYYELYLNGSKIVTLRIAPFARITSATIKYEYTENSKVQYVINYVITNENNQVDTIEHFILERNPNFMKVYLDDNLQPTSSFKITREARLSKISVDFGFINENLYQNIILSVHNIDGKYIYTEDEIYLGYQNDMFVFYITGLLDKGLKTYKLELLREEGLEEYYELGLIDIEKSPGTSAYLLDIRFTLSDNEVIVEYPLIRVLDENGERDDSYDPRVYSDGIDYANTIEANKTSFLVVGKVADILLEHYSPRFYLPYGATIERYDENKEEWVTDLYDNFASEDEEVQKVVKYRVKSEDTKQVVEYFISVIDISYNLSLRFKIYYELPNGTLIDANASNSPIKNKVVLISLKNLILDSDYPTTGSKVSDFPNLNESNIDGVFNQASLFFFLRETTDQVYRFGRNKTGAYNFNVVTPIYTGPPTDKLIPGQRYMYDIYMMPVGVENWKTNDYKLPALSNISSDYTGLFYYVYSTSPYLITRDLAIVIKPQTSTNNWGLYDDYTSWD